MKISVFFDREFHMKIPYDSLVGFRLFCEKQGLYSSYNMSEQRMDLYSSLHQERVRIFSENKGKASQDFVQEILRLLAAGGLSSLTDQGKAANSVPGLSILLDVTEGMHGHHPSILIEHQPLVDERLRNMLLSELNENKMAFQFKEVPAVPTASGRLIRIKCRLPQLTETSSVYEQVKLILARAIMRYLHRYHQEKPFAYLPADKQKAMLKRLWSSSESVPSRETEEAGEASSAEIKEADSQKTIQAVKREAKAEIFFDYTVLPPQKDSEGEGFLINGNLYMKNTGNEILHSPVICIKVPAGQGVSLQGQIIPPRMVSGMATIGSSGEKGWRYVYEDWRERVKSKGEYWITSIQALQINPGETAVFPAYKITIDYAEERNAIAIGGFVYFNEGKHVFSSNNSISFSF
ncbi:hypothetical protein ACQCVE_15630 [Metabacillus sp. 113a]|uniref:hypothetical protein n=1 Tax=Metabacillus sp. 113a TaxID=3404706 RepID=UPI003CFAD8EB